MKTFLLALFAAIVLTLAPAVSEAAKASADEPPAYLFEHCISWAEFQTLTGGTMSDFEARYGLTGYGTVVRTADHGSVVIKQYRWCGQFPDAVMVQVAFVLNKAGQYKAVDAVEFDYRSPLQHHPLR